MGRLRRQAAVILAGCSAILATAVMATTAQAATVHPSSTHVVSTLSAPRPPAGFKGTSVNPATARGATVRIITLNPKTCAEYNRTNPGTVPGCRAKLYSYSRNYQALPRGTSTASPGGTTAASPRATTAASSYWYWTAGDKECSIYGCWYWSANLTMDGVANGSHVYQWNVGCTPSGYETYCGYDSGQWYGYFYNGGGWPNYAMQFGENSKSCVAPYNIGCFGHGQRQWIDDWGNRSTYYYW